jgi:protein-histidine pros-kinase
MMGTKPQPTRLERPKKEPLDRPRLDGLLNAGSILESVADAIVVIAQDGTIIRVNAQTETLFGYTRDELLGRSIETLLPERFRHQHVDSRRDYYANPRPRPMGVGMELYARRKDGQELPVEISLSPLKTAEGLFVISSIRDITERVKGIFRELRY